MKFFRFAVFILTLCAAASARADLVDGVVAVVNNAVITRQEVQDFAMPAIDALRRQYSSDSPEYEDKLNSALTNSLELLIERQLILHYFDTAGYQLPDSAVDELVNERIHERFGDRVTLMKTLQAEGETFEQFREDVREQYIEFELRKKNVSENIVVSPYQIEQYYKAHQADYQVEDEVKLRMIVLNKPSAGDTNVLELAREIRQNINGGASFAEMASVYSQGSEAKQGGEMGWLEHSALRKELTDAAFALKPGEVSNVIDTPEACYLLLVEDKQPAHFKPLTDVRDEIEQMLRAQKHDELERQWIESLKKDTFIRIFA